MAYKIVEAVERPTEYYLKVLANSPEADPEKQVFREFHWGLDVPQATIKKETKLYLDAEFKVAADKALAGITL